MNGKSCMIHETAEVSAKATVGDGARIWNWVQVRENAFIGNNTILSKGVYIDTGVKIGNNVKIQNNVSVFHGVEIEDGVFVGPHVCFTNDKFPRAVNPDGTLKGTDDWSVSKTILRYGCSIGANATVAPGVTVGKFAMVGAGSVVTRDVPDYGLVFGNPARLAGYVCLCGNRLDGTNYCASCETKVEIGGNCSK